MNQNSQNRYEELIEPQERDEEEQRLIDEYMARYCNGQKSPLAKAGLFSRLFFFWINPVLKVTPNTNKNLIF